MSRLRHDPPSTLGTGTVESIDDFIDGFGPFAASNILRMWVGTTARVVVRPSGTEPKLKVYIDAWSRSGSAAERRAAAEAQVAELDGALRALTS